ncbi:1-deoxy-D-xylulose-5-phosphate synthase [Bacteroidota bacterium]
MDKGGLLDKINFPSDLRKISEIDLIKVCNELRQFIIDSASTNPGHFGASLGVVELTIALHYVFNTPDDQIIWDVGHQAYGHKIITGRRSQFHTNRKYKGISGFPSPKESEYDAFGVGHSSTSISAALGMAVANKFDNNKNRKTIAVIGDGSMTAGLAFEGLNNAGIEKSNLLVILNDNNISIDPSVGALKEYLVDIATSRTYNRFKNETWNILGKISKYGPNARMLVQKLDNALKSMMLNQSNLFESLNFRYFGPVDGHNINHLTKVLKDLKDIDGPKLLHILTKKGKGFKQAEIDQTVWHAPGKFDKKTGEIIKSEFSKPEPPKYQDVFGHTIVELAEKNSKIIGITPAMPSGSSLKIMMEKMPERTFDVGIAEQHAVTFSAGLASQGYLPFCNIYSTFIQRAYDQVVHDVALQNLNVVFCLDRGGLVGSDGATHHGNFDMAFMRCVPGLTISAPMDEIELRNLMYTAQLKDQGPFVIRYPRGKGVHTDWRKPMKKITIGKGRCISKGEKLAILSIGHVGNCVKKVSIKLKKEKIVIGHYDLRFIKPLDDKLLHEVLNKYQKIITVEDGAITGGFGSSILEFMTDNNYKADVIRLGIPDRFINHGSQQELYKECNFDETSIYEAVIKMIK